MKSRRQIPSDARENKYTRHMGPHKHKKYNPLLESGHLVLISYFLSSSFSSLSCYVSNWPLHFSTGQLYPPSSTTFVFHYSFNNPIFPVHVSHLPTMSRSVLQPIRLKQVCLFPT